MQPPHEKQSRQMLPSSRPIESCSTLVVHVKKAARSSQHGGAHDGSARRNGITAQDSCNGLPSPSAASYHAVTVVLSAAGHSICRVCHIRHATCSVVAMHQPACSVWSCLRSTALYAHFIGRTACVLHGAGAALQKVEFRVRHFGEVLIFLVLKRGTVEFAGLLNVRVWSMWLRL